MMVVADIESTELNQAWLGYTLDKTEARLGRQRLVLDNHRFIGDVGWRQNMQTFDGLVLQDKCADKLALTYGYLWQINRIFGHDHPQGTWDSDSHVLNIAFSGLPGGTLTGYAYLLDFDNAPAQSCATYGASFAGSVETGEVVSLYYRGEYAVQVDYGSSALDYRTDYWVGEFGVGTGPVVTTLGYERLGSDDGVPFRTPLATLHAFNGWADMFLTTPAGGLEDLYLKAVATLPRGWSLAAWYHIYEDTLGDDLGKEFDLSVSWKINKQFTVLAKAADFSGEGTQRDMRKFWLQAEFAY